MHVSYPYNAESPVFDNQAMTGLVADSNQAGDVVLNSPIQVANNVNDSLCDLDCTVAVFSVSDSLVADSTKASVVVLNTQVG